MYWIIVGHTRVQVKLIQTLTMLLHIALANSTNSHTKRIITKLKSQQKLLAEIMKKTVHKATTITMAWGRGVEVEHTACSLFHPVIELIIAIMIDQWIQFYLQ